MAIFDNKTVVKTSPHGTPPLGEHGFYSYDIHGTDTDYKDQLQLHSLFSMLQEAASLNAADYGWGAGVMDELNSCWLLLRMSLRMTKRPAWLEKITVETWSRGSDRLYFMRDFLIYDGHGELIGTGSSVWIVADKITHRPLRPIALMQYATLAADPLSAMGFDPPKIKPLMDITWMKDNINQRNTLVKYGDYSEIDRNLHVNNTRYVAWCLDAAHSKSLDQGEVFGIDICYNSEIVFGEKVILFFGNSESNNFQVDGYVAGTNRVAFSAILYGNLQ